MRRYLTFLPLLVKVLILGRQAWIKPRIDLEWKVDLLFSPPPPAATASSGRAARSITSRDYVPTRHARRRLPRSHRSIN